MMNHNETGKKQSFISDARRSQIIHAAIVTLDEIGYVNASLAQIARRAGISTALISYHFKNKHELMDYTLETLINDVASFVIERTKAEESCRQKLHAYIRSNLAYRATHPGHYSALVEIIFNARTSEGVPYYKLSDPDDEEPLILELQHILTCGQDRGEFRNFNVQVVAYAIQGAIWEYVATPRMVAKIDTVSYSEELVSLFDRAVLSDKTITPSAQPS